MHASYRWLIVAIFCLAAALPISTSSQAALTPGAPAAFSILPGAPKTLTVDVQDGEFLQITFDGQGTLARVSIVDQAGRLVTTRERRGGVRTPIVWAGVSHRATTLIISIHSLESGTTARPFVVELDARRPATQTDRHRAAASIAIERGEAAEREGAARLGEAVAAYQDALAQWREADDARGQASALFEVGRVQAEQGRTQDADQAFTLALDVCRRLRDERCEGRALHLLGRLVGMTGRPQPGVDTLQQALAIRQRLKDIAGQAETRLEIGGIEATRSGNHRAEQFLTEAVEQARASGDRRTEADALNMHAVLDHSRGDFDQSRQRYEAALAIRQAIGDLAGEAQTTSNVGVLLRSQGELREAIASYEKALVIRRRLGVIGSIANTVHNLGVAHADLGEHERAMDLFREGIDLFRKTGFRRGEAFALLALGQSHAKLGHAEPALEHYEQALPVWKTVGDKRGESQTRMAAASLHSARGDYPRAAEQYLAAAELARSGGYKREIGMSLVGRATVERLQGQLDRALADAREGHALLEEIGERREAGRALAEVGATLFAAGRLAEADLATRDAILVFEDVEDRGEEALARMWRARISDRRGDAADVRHQAIASLDLIESARASITSEGLSQSLFASKREMYDLAIGLLMRLSVADPQGDDDRHAFAVSERMRARALLDLLASGELRLSDRDATLASQLRRVQELVNAKATRLTRLLGPTRGQSTTAIAAARRELDELLARLDRIRADLRTQTADLGEWARVEPLTVEQVQRQLDARTAVIEYAVGEAQTHAWVITHDGVHPFRAPGRRELARLARAVHTSLGTSDAPVGPAGAATPAPPTPALNATLGALAHATLAPAAAALRGRTRILLVVDGPLHSIPFSLLSLPHSSSQLGATHELVMLPSATVGEALRTRATARPVPRQGIAVIADPVFARNDPRLGDATLRSSAADARWPRLRFSGMEAEAIARLAPGRTTQWSDFDASRSAALHSRLGEYGVIHLATHAVIDEKQPQLSAIVLAQVSRDGREQDGLVRVHELYNLSLNARLVVLSACRTALGQHVEGEGLIGLARGFLHAGANAVVASLWDVDDHATAAFMSRFYDALIAKGRSPAAALRAAQQEQRKDSRWSDPRDWAGFVLIGYSP